MHLLKCSLRDSILLAVLSMAVTAQPVYALSCKAAGTEEGPASCSNDCPKNVPVCHTFHESGPVVKVNIVGGLLGAVSFGTLHTDFLSFGVGGVVIKKTGCQCGPSGVGLLNPFASANVGSARDLYSALANAEPGAFGTGSIVTDSLCNNAHHDSEQMWLLVRFQGRQYQLTLDEVTIIDESFEISPSESSTESQGMF